MAATQFHLVGKCGGHDADVDYLRCERVLTSAQQVTDSETGELIAMSQSASKLDGTKFTVQISEEGLPILDAIVTSFALLEARAKAAQVVALTRESSF